MMKFKRRITLFLTILIIGSCISPENQQSRIERIRMLSEKSGIEATVIDEAEKIAKTQATRFQRNVIQPVKQEMPTTKTVELPGISLLVDHAVIEKLVDSLNDKFSCRQCLSFISNDDTRSDAKQTISMIKSGDKYNTLRFQETRGGSYRFATDSLIIKLQLFEKKYPFHFIGVGDDWLLIKTENKPADWLDFAEEVLKVCPLEEKVDTAEYAKGLMHDEGKISMWWD